MASHFRNTLNKLLKQLLASCFAYIIGLEAANMKIAALKVTVDALKKDKIKQSHGKIFSNL